MSIATWSPDGKLGAVALKAAGLVAASATETAVEVGKGKFRIVSNITAIETASNNEMYNVVLEANSRSATTTWNEIGTLFARGASETTGRSADDSTDEEEIIVDNPYDYQVRVHTYVVGSISTGINYTVDAYYLLSQH
jgi:hypothetical protein